MNWQGFLSWLQSLLGSANNTGGTNPPDNGGQPAPRPPVTPPVRPTPAPVPPVTPAPTAPQPVPPVVPTPVPTPAPAPTPVSPPPERPPVVVPPTVELPTEGVKLGFGKLWSNHPNISHNEMQPCRREDNVPNFGNQCAIRMGTCLTRSNLMQGYDGVQCWFGHGGQGHSLRARELALWIRNNPSKFGPVEIKTGVQWQDYVGRTGIIFCQNFWGENNSGDHIDLWDGTGEFMGGGSFSWEGPAMASGGLDYIERSEDVWFWPVH